jgi:hypothetical protein
MKFVIRANLVSIACHQLRYIYRAQNGVASRNGKVCGAASRGEVCDYCAKKMSTDIWKELSSKNCIYKWHKLYEETGCDCKGRNPGKEVPEGQVDAIGAGFVHSPPSPKKISPTWFTANEHTFKIRSLQIPTVETSKCQETTTSTTNFAATSARSSL